MAHGSGGNQTFNCSWQHCGKSFNRKSDLSRHFRIHTNERPYHCAVEWCSKRFIQRSALTVHSRTHTGERPYVCDNVGCQKPFSDSSGLARHRRIHTGDRPFICQEPTCKRSFCRKTILAKHQVRSHAAGSLTKPFFENAISEHSLQCQPVTVSMPSIDYYHFAPHVNHLESSTPSRATDSVKVQGHEFTPQIMAQTASLSTLPLSMANSEQQHQQHQQQSSSPSEQQQQCQLQTQCMQNMQPGCGSNPRANRPPPEQRELSFLDSHMPDGQPLVFPYYSHCYFAP